MPYETPGHDGDCGDEPDQRQQRDRAATGRRAR
jgi:hypothetical protein